jgi:hypothetical protein
VKEMKVTIERTSERVERTSERVERMDERVERMDERIEEEFLLNNDPWNNLMATSIGKCEISKEDFAKEYGLNIRSLPCMISAIIPPRPSNNQKPNLKLAHIMPRSTKMHILNSLGLDSNDIDSLKNMLVLCSGFEEAFDKQHISFVPNSNPFAGGFIVKFWKDEFKYTPLFNGCNDLIGLYDRSSLNLIVNGNMHTIFRRALSYHTFMSFRKWKRDVVHLSLPTDCDLSNYNGSYQKTRHDYLLQINKDINIDNEEA